MGDDAMKGTRRMPSIALCTCGVMNLARLFVVEVSDSPHLPNVASTALAISLPLTAPSRSIASSSSFFWRSYIAQFNWIGLAHGSELSCERKQVPCQKNWANNGHSGEVYFATTDERCNSANRASPIILFAVVQ